MPDVLAEWAGLQRFPPKVRVGWDSLRHELADLPVFKGTPVYIRGHGFIYVVIYVYTPVHIR